MSTTAPTPAVANARARVAALTRSRTPDDPRFVDAQRDLAAAKIEGYIERIVASAPPLTPTQRAKLAALIGGAS